MKDIDFVKDLATEYVCPVSHQLATQYEKGLIDNLTYFGLAVLKTYKIMHNITTTE
jgi:hypothetical protein